MAKELTLTSVGIDIGTTTTQLVLSRLSLVNVMPGSQIPKIEITHKCVVYLGNVYFTPFVDRQRVDGGALRQLIAREYAAAGIGPADIDTGAIIITGEAAKKDNAAEIIHALAEYAGDFVVATAGPAMESVIAGKGSGAEELSRRLRARVVNIDIGGGTSNIACFERGRCLGTACVNVGGRLFEVDPLSHRLSYISPPAQLVVDIVGKRRGKPLFPAADAAGELAGIRGCLDYMADLVDRVLFGESTDPAAAALLMGNDLPGGPADGIVYSGGVAGYIYQPGLSDWWVHGDVGPLLAEAYRRGRAYRNLEVLQGAETLHATVLGAGSHTVNVSGSTVTVSARALPLRNVPAVYPEERPDGSWTWLKAAGGFSASLYRTVALVVPPLADTDFTTITALAKRLASELKEITGRPKVVVAQQDIGKVLGQCLLRQLPGEELVCLDGIGLQLGDFLDIARPLPHAEAVPVIVKTLVFAR